MTTLGSCIAALLLALAAPAWAHDGGHDEAPVAVAADAPQRLPDASVALPKRSQYQFGIRTVLAESRETARAIELAGKLVMDPNAGGKVQALVAGRVAPGPNGIPHLGQKVRKGQVLAYLEGAASGFERASQQGQLAELRANKSVAEQRVARLQQLEGSVPHKEIEAARLELQSLTQKLAAFGGGGREALTAPVDGVVAAANVVAGQVVDARETLFEVADPARYYVEALAYDAAEAASIDAAQASVGAGRALPLTFVGNARSLREQAIVLQFALRASAAGVPLALGQPLRVVASTRDKVKGIPVPAAAVVKNAGNQDIVWVHASAERFVPRTVRLQPIDGASVLVVDGVAPGERVVAQGASLLNQVR